MAADAKSFGISLGVNAAICALCLIFFGFFRATKITEKFYAPKRFLPEQTFRPRKLSKSFWGWIMPTLRASEEEVILVAGVDAAMYVRLFKFGLELFTFTTIFVLITVLPTNLVGHEVVRLIDSTRAPGSPFTYWISPPPAGADAPPAPDNTAVKAPSFYEKAPPAPPGIQWWAYKAEVPNEVYTQLSAQSLGPQFSNYGWKYDSDFQTQSYTFSQLDHATMSNVSPKSRTLWVHMISVWIISLYTFWMLRRFSKHAVSLRLRHFASVKKGAESHSVLVLDVPGVQSGRFLERMDVFLPFLPNAFKRIIRKRLQAAQKAAHTSAESFGSKLTGTLSDTLDSGTAGASRMVAAMTPKHRNKRSKESDDIYSSTSNVDLLNNAARSSGDKENGGSVNVDLGTKKGAETAIRHPEAVTEMDTEAKCYKLIEGGMSPQQVVEREYRELYPGDLAAVHMVFLCPDLDKLVQEYDKLNDQLLDLLDGYTSMKRRGKPMKRKTTRVLGIKYGDWGKQRYPGKKPVKTDALDWYVSRITEVRRRIHEELPAATEESTSTAFVTFRSRKAQMVASNSMQHHDERAWKVQTAPGADELIWGNLRWRTWEHSLRTALIWSAFIALTLFYLIPVSAVQALVEVDRLRKIPVFKQLVNITFINAILQSILPSLVLKIFLAILPTLLAFMNKKQGMVSTSAVDFGVTTKYFIFQVVSVFLGSFIAGSLFTQFEQWIHNPTSAINIIGTSAPLTSIFFLNYVELNALTSIPVQFLRIVGILLFWVLTLLSGTERAKARRWSNQYIKFGPDVPNHTMTILFGLVFSVINPLLPPMCLIYFCIANLTEKYNMLYVERPQYQSGGQMWRQIFDQVIVGLLFFQVIMAALLGIKQSFSAILLIPLIVLTLVVRSSCLALFDRPLHMQSVRAAVDLDSKDQQGTISEDGEQEFEQADTYLQPAFKFSDAACDALLAEAREMEEVLAGHKDVPAEDAAAGEEPQQELGEDEDAADRSAHAASRNNSRSPGTGASTDISNGRSSQNLGHEAV